MRLLDLLICEKWLDLYLTVRPLVGKWTHASFGSAERYRTSAPVIAEPVLHYKSCNQAFTGKRLYAMKKAIDIFQISLCWENFLSSLAMASKYKPHMQDHCQHYWSAA